MIVILKNLTLRAQRGARPEAGEGAVLELFRRELDARTVARARNGTRQAAAATILLCTSAVRVVAGVPPAVKDLGRIGARHLLRLDRPGNPWSTPPSAQ